MKMRATLQELEIFIAVARHLNFRKAAEERNVTPSTLSHTISNFEQRIGVRLLSRTTRSVALTEAGSAFLRRIEPAMLDLSLAVDELNDWRSDPRGTLRLNLPRSAEKLYLRTMLLPFRRRYPEIALEVTTSDSFVNIVESGFDAGVRFGEAIPQDMVAIPFGPKIRGAVVASPDFIARYGTPQHPRDLVNFSCIQHRFPSGVNYKWEFSDNGQPLEIAVTGGLTLDNDAMMTEAACDGEGLAFVIKSTVQARLASGELNEVLADFAAPSAGFWLYYPGRKYYSTALRCFVEYLQEFNRQAETLPPQ